MRIRVLNRYNKKAVVFTLLTFLFTLNCNSQPPLFKAPAYIDHYTNEAVEQMIEHRIPASVILAQAILESNSGTSDLAKKSNNHFGIKCHVQWGGDTIIKTDDTSNECFRKYSSVKDSYSDHSLFLKSRARYSFLFELPLGDYKAWCRGLKASGYATYPWYAEELIEIIESNQLYEIDRAEKMVSGKILLNQASDIRLSNISLKNFTPKDIFSSEALFIDEKDVLIQSLELLINNEIEEIAGN